MLEPSLAEVQSRLEARSGESLASDDILRHIVTRVTDEGLIIEIFDLGDAPLFERATAEPTATLRAIADLLASVLALTENGLAIAAHIRAHPVVLANNPVWDLSAARANRMRLLLEAAGTPGARIRRVTGHGDRVPVTENPMAIRNNRLEVILLRADPDAR